MIFYIDSAVVKLLSDIFKAPYESFYYGSFNAALNSHIRKVYKVDDISKRPGEILLPFVSWYRNVSSDPDRKDATYPITVREGTVSKSIELLYVMYNYTIEVLSDSVMEQNGHIRDFLFKFSTRPSLNYMFRGEPLYSKLEVDDPQDTTELDEEEDLGRRIRTTYTFRVQVPLFREMLSLPPADNVLFRTNQYYPSSPTQASFPTYSRDGNVTTDKLGEDKDLHEDLNTVSDKHEQTEVLTDTPGVKKENINTDAGLSINTDDFIFIE